MFHIILTGVDKAGKSTLARELSKKLYMPIVNRLQPKENIFIECIDFLKESKQPFIIDRFHIDEEVYGPIKRSGSRFDFRQYKIIELAMLSLNTINIVCEDDEDEIKHRFAKNHEEFLTTDEAEAVLDGYQREVKKSILKWKHYRIGDSIADIAEELSKTVTQDDIRRHYLFYEYGTIGNYDGTTLIVGEKYGDKLLKPLVPFGNNEPGLKLFKSLDIAGIDWRSVIMTNAYKYDERTEKIDEGENFAQELVSLQNVDKIVCLGEKAFKVVSFAVSDIMHKAKVVKIPHPSYMFSYNNKSIEEYSEIIKKVLHE
jgi:uracil-DNA glycosylase